MCKWNEQNVCHTAPECSCSGGCGYSPISELQMKSARLWCRCLGLISELTPVVQQQQRSLAGSFVRHSVECQDAGTFFDFQLAHESTLCKQVLLSLRFWITVAGCCFTGMFTPNGWHVQKTSSTSPPLQWTDNTRYCRGFNLCWVHLYDAVIVGGDNNVFFMCRKIVFYPFSKPNW